MASYCMLIQHLIAVLYWHQSFILCQRSHVAWPKPMACQLSACCTSNEKRSMMLFVCPDLSPSCLFHCHYRDVDEFVRLWGWDVEYCCTLYFQGRLSKYLHNYMHLRTPLPFVYTLASSLGSELSSTESRAEQTTPPLVFGFASPSPLQTNMFGVHQHLLVFPSICEKPPCGLANEVTTNSNSMPILTSIPGPIMVLHLYRRVGRLCMQGLKSNTQGKTQYKISSKGGTQPQCCGYP